MVKAAVAFEFLRSQASRKFLKLKDTEIQIQRPLHEKPTISKRMFSLFPPPAVYKQSNEV